MSSKANGPPKGTVRLGTWFYSRDEVGKRHDDGFDWINGKVQFVVGARYAVWKYLWTGTEWRRFRRVTGPLRRAAAATRQQEMTDHASRS